VLEDAGMDVQITSSSSLRLQTFDSIFSRDTIWWTV